jgi:hypothetical protein
MQAFDLVRQLAASQYLVRSLHVAAELGVADAIGERPRPIVDVAQDIGANADALRRILTLLASRGLFQLRDGYAQNSEASEFLRTDHPASLRSFVRMFGQLIQWRSAEDLEHAVRTGESVATHVFPGGGLWGYFDANPEQGRVFGEAMVAKSTVQIADVLAAIDFSRFGHIVDVGGGTGHMLRAILDRCPAVTGSLLDLPTVVEQATSHGRMSVAPGDFFVTPLPSADAAILMEVLHDWDDAGCAKILSAARRAIGNTGRLLVIEIEMTTGPGPDWPKLLDVVMLAVFGARQRTNAEYDRLLQANGFTVERQISTPAGLTIIEASAA